MSTMFYTKFLFYFMVTSQAYTRSRKVTVVSSAYKRKRSCADGHNSFERKMGDGFLKDRQVYWIVLMEAAICSASVP
jgi:hypothetical protein